MKKVIKNFIYPEIDETTRSYGVSLGPIVRESGDWRDVRVPDEEQRQNNVESSSCYVEASQKGIATLQEALFSLKDQNYSARFNALLSGGTEVGGDPIKGAMSIKKDGLIPEEMMSFKDIDSWEEYHSWEGVDLKACKQKGQEFLDRWGLHFKIVAEREDPIETKYSELREALKRGPVAISVFAWRERNGLYYKPVGKRDTHLTLAVYLDEQNRIHVRDSYAPYEKILEPKTNFEFAITWAVEKKPHEETLGILGQILQKLAELIGLTIKQKASVQAPQPPTVPTREKISVELLATAIRDYEGYYPGSRSFRNCNPGNCRYSTKGYLSIYGVVGKDPQGFAIFRDYATGWLYLKNLILHKAKQNPEHTLYEFTKIYAPAEDHNDPLAYAKYLAKRLDVATDFKIGNII